MGETTDFSKAEYKYTKGNSYDTYIGDDISGTQYDVAHVIWGQNWVLPSIEQFIELFQCCERKEYTLMGQKGYVIVGKNGNKIFLPFGGRRWYETDHNSISYEDENQPDYWTSSLDVGAQAFAWHYGKYSLTRPYGCNVRAIKK